MTTKSKLQNSNYLKLMSVLSFNYRIAELNDLSVNAESDLPHFVVSDVYFLLLFNITRSPVHKHLFG